MTLRVLIAVVALVAGSAIAQTPSGEIAGRMTDTQRTPLPGVRIRVTNGDQSNEAHTDHEGRFEFRSLTMGTYRVVAELGGFKAASGEITLSPPTPSAFLAWSLDVGCPAEIRVILGARSAARLVDAIVHIRVASAHGPVRISVRPDCEGQVFENYAVLVLGSAPGRVKASLGQRQMFMEPWNARLAPGQEYIALLWRDGFTTDDLLLPIVLGRVASPGVGELNGLRPSEALGILGKWSEGTQH